MNRLLVVGTLEESNCEAILDTETGEVHESDSLSSLVSYGTSGYIVGSKLFRHIGPVCRTYANHPNFVCSIRSAKRKIIIRGRDTPALIGTFQPEYLGFRLGQVGSARTGDRRRLSRIFQCMDLEEISQVSGLHISEAHEYALSILCLCEARGITFTSSRGGLASRLLRASPNWEKGRHSAPHFVNDLVREKLPGNFYALGTAPYKRHNAALYVDQISAHHTVASSTPVPDPSSIRARGNDRSRFGVWLSGQDADRFFETHYGLAACMITVHSIPDARKHLFPPWMHTPGHRIEYIYTNEREFLDGRYGTMDYVAASWTGMVTDTAIQEYARWALQERALGVGRKPVLLAAYGIVAGKYPQSTAYYRPDRPSPSGIYKGKARELPTVGRMREVWVTRNSSPLAHVLARGIIESETRRRSLLYARELDSIGAPILGVYVDGLIVDTDRLPFLPEGWSVEAELTDLVFKDARTYVSNERTRAPGIPRSSAAGMLLAARGNRPDRVKARQDELMPF